jgi:hypothetical protein
MFLNMNGFLAIQHERGCANALPRARKQSTTLELE